MGLNKKAQEYLDKCRVIGITDVKEGIIVSSNYSSEFKVSIIKVKNGNVTEELLEEFSLTDFFDRDDSKMILNFKRIIASIVGRKRYYIETNIYNFLINKDIESEELEIDDDLNYDDAEERAMREAAEEEAAEHEFERFLRIQEEM